MFFKSFSSVSEIFLINFPGLPAHNSLLFMIAPGGIKAPAATKPKSSIIALSKITDPMPINELDPISQAWIVALWPIVTLSEIIVDYSLPLAEKP